MLKQIIQSLQRLRLRIYTNLPTLLFLIGTLGITATLVVWNHYIGSLFGFSALIFMAFYIDKANQPR